MKSMISTMLFFILLIFSTINNAQNVGVGVVNPSEKLEVGGVIFTNDGGIRFPDNSLQTTAAFSKTITDAAEKRLLPFMQIDGIPGTWDTLGIEEAIPLLHSQNVNQAIIDATGVTGFLNGEYVLVKNTDVSTVAITQKFLFGQNIPHITIFYIAEDPAFGSYIYLVIKLSNVIISEHETNTQYAGNGHYVHFETLKINFKKLAFTDYLSGECFCLIFETGLITNCGCP